MTGSARAPRKRRRISFGERMRRRVDRVVHWLTGIGVSNHVLDFVLHWWTRLGTAGAVMVILAVVLPAGGYAALAYSTSRSIPGWIGDFGVEFEAADWDIHLLSLSTVARDVKIRRDAHSEPVFSAAEVEFNGSLGTVLSSFFGRGGAFHEITIRHGEVLVERSLTGDYNWADFLRAVPAERRRDAMDGLYTIHAIHLADMRGIYVEHLPGGSGGGVVRTASARVIIEGLNGHLLSLRPPARTGERPTEISLKARLADGVIEMKGEAGLFPDQIADAVRAAATPASTVRVSTTSQVGDARGPSYALKIYLENIGMGAYGQMVSTTQIVPSSGRLGGRVELELTPAAFRCTCNLAMEDVGFQPNVQLVATRATYDDLHRSLAGYRKSGPFDLCGSPLDGVRDSRPTDGTVTAMAASFNFQATDQAPANVRRVTANDQHAFAGELASAVADEFLRDSPSDTAVTRSLKNVGKGLKRVIGK